jgi:hypothetical protein
MADPHLLAQALALIALIGGTIEYCQILERRQRRIEDAAARLTAESGLRGLVRVLAADQ